MIDKLREFSAHMNELSQSLTGSSRELLTTTESMNRGGHEQTDQTEQVASAVTQMLQTCIDVAENADLASQSAKETSSAAREDLEMTANWFTTA